MNTLAVEMHPQAHNIICDDTSITVELVDGRTITAPLLWFPRLAKASEAELNNCEIL